jgi:hypothetical protein
LYRVAMVLHWSPEATRWKRSQLGVMPSWIGVGVAMPLPGAVVVGVGSDPMTPTQTYVLSQRLVQVDPIAGFQAARWAMVTPYSDPMLVHPSPETTRWNRLQLPTMPSWIGVGVGMPLPGVVVVVGAAVVLSPPMIPTQRWVLSHRLLHVLPIAGFQAASWARLTLYLDPIAVQPSPETTR